MYPCSFLVIPEAQADGRNLKPCPKKACSQPEAGGRASPHAHVVFELLAKQGAEDVLERSRGGGGGGGVEALSRVYIIGTSKGLGMPEPRQERSQLAAKHVSFLCLTVCNPVWFVPAHM